MRAASSFVVVVGFKAFLCAETHQSDETKSPGGAAAAEACADSCTGGNESKTH